MKPDLSISTILDYFKHLDSEKRVLLVSTLAGHLSPIEKTRLNRSSPIPPLADEIFLAIFKLCSTKTLFSLSLVSRKWNSIIQDNHLWKSIYVLTPPVTPVKSMFGVDFKTLVRKQTLTSKNWRTGAYKATAIRDRLCMEFTDDLIASISHTGTNGKLVCLLYLILFG